MHSLKVHDRAVERLICFNHVNCAINYFNYTLIAILMHIITYQPTINDVITSILACQLKI